MKNTSRIHRKTTSESQDQQGKKPSIHGQIKNKGADALEELKQMFQKKSCYERKIECVMRWLLDTDDPDEMLASDEIKDAIRGIYSHLPLTEEDLNGYFFEAKKQLQRPKVGKGWIAVNISKLGIIEMRKLAAAQGMTYRLFCENALRDAMLNARKELGLSLHKTLDLRPRDIKRLAELTNLKRRMDLTCVPEKN